MSVRPCCANKTLVRAHLTTAQGTLCHEWQDAGGAPDTLHIDPA
jgi:hypothetical protein